MTVDSATSGVTLVLEIVKSWIYFKEGDVYEYWYPDWSRLRGKFKVRPGNPENL